MRLTLNLLGLELDITFGIATTEDPDEPGRDLGYTAGSFIGFAPHVASEMVPLPQHTPSWDEPDE